MNAVAEPRMVLRPTLTLVWYTPSTSRKESWQ